MEGSPAPVVEAVMAQKTIAEFSSPSANFVATGPNLNLGDATFELKPALINMVQANPFCGKPHEDANDHLQDFLEVCNKNVTEDAIRLCLFPFSLFGEGEAVVLRQQEQSDNLGQVCQFFPQEVISSGQDQCPVWEDFKLPATVR